MRYLIASLLMAAVGVGARAEVKTEVLKYKCGDTVLNGFTAWDDAKAGKRPGVLVVHEWWGLNDYAKMRATRLAELGCLAFAVDMYGDGKTTKDPKEAAQWAGELRVNRKLMRERINAALETLKKDPRCDSSRTAAIGYCFGGGVVLELARSGVDVSGVASFHGNLDTPNPEDARKIKARVLVLHGADDPNVPPSQVAAFQDEMRKAKVDWEMIYFGGAVHSFTNPASGDDPSKGVAYNEKADRRSWDAMLRFFDEIFEKR